MLASEKNKLTGFDWAKPTRVFKFCSNLTVWWLGFFFSLCSTAQASRSKKVMSEFVNVMSGWKQHIGSREKAGFLSFKLLQPSEYLHSGMKLCST